MLSGRRLLDCAGRGEDPRGATMYVTLEPCAHQGRQPPCVDAILEAGIGRVVIASDDPSEKASGRGPGMLRDGEVKVEFAAGEEATAARLLNQPFRKHARTGLPLVTLKLAMSLDGQTTTPEGDSPGSRGAKSQQLVHRWRAESDAMAVGIGTVLADDPLLTARFAPDCPARQPIRVVFDRQARLPLDSQLLQTLDGVAGAGDRLPDADPDRVTGSDGTPARRSSLPTTSTPCSPTSVAAASPASSWRAAEPSPPLFSRWTPSTSRAPSSPRSFWASPSRRVARWRGPPRGAGARRAPGERRRDRTRRRGFVPNRRPMATTS